MDPARQGFVCWKRESRNYMLPATSIPYNDFSPGFFLSFCISWKKEDDVRIEAYEDDSEAEGSGGEMDIKELRAKKQALARKVAEQQRRQDKIQVGQAEELLCFCAWADPASLCRWCAALSLPRCRTSGLSGRPVAWYRCPALPP